MGNSASSSGRGQHEETVDLGFLVPQGIYTGPRDWNEAIVAQLIIDRKLAPFYRPLEDYDDSWDDDQILAARRDPTPAPDSDSTHTARSDVSSASKSTHHKRPSATKELARSPEAAIYRGATECPICFLYYPPNINHSRCCDQAICTECFVQIKRAEPTVTHLVSEPSCCPYCVQENFGVVYTPPPWRTGIGSDGSTPPAWPESPGKAGQHPLEGAATSLGKQRRRKSYNHDDAEVVTIDQIRPDWEAKLATVRAQAARRANRRIIMRQVGDRLIPVGVTSGRVHALPEGVAGENGEGAGTGTSGRRSRRRQQEQLNQLLGGMGGQDLEELMVMEAMRLSLLEHEEQQRREAQQRAQNGGEGGSGGGEGANASPATGDTTTTVPAQPTVNGASGGSSNTPSPHVHTPPTPSPLSAPMNTSTTSTNSTSTAVAPPTSTSTTTLSPPSPTTAHPDPNHLSSPSLSASAQPTPVPSAPPSPSVSRTPLPDTVPVAVSPSVPTPKPPMQRFDSDASSSVMGLDTDSEVVDGEGRAVQGASSYFPLSSTDSLVSQEPLLQEE
ncbi:hypothetical protein DENSPDRAFT_837332 [Dentipellis sp. KUC8613]|nr:hypothetical protein DENSPDRAFT_837332 [Dentipellis sp. KUC8613]